MGSAVRGHIIPDRLAVVVQTVDQGTRRAGKIAREPSVGSGPSQAEPKKKPRQQSGEMNRTMPHGRSSSQERNLGFLCAFPGNIACTSKLVFYLEFPFWTSRSHSV